MWQRLILVYFLGGAIACGPSHPQRSVNSRTADPNTFVQAANHLLSQADRQETQEAKRLQLQAVEHLLAGSLMTEAISLLAAVDTEGAGPELNAFKTILEARIALIEQKPERALRILKRIWVPTELSSYWQRLLHVTRSQAYLQMDHHFAAVRELVALDVHLVGEPQKQNQEQIWQLLTDMTTGALTTLEVDENDNTSLLGWICLARITKSDLAPEPLLAELRSWKKRFPEHCADQRLPGLQALTVETPQFPKKVAIMLPLTGKFASSAKAIQTGLLSAYYEDKKKYPALTPELVFLDTQEDTRVKASYKQALAAQADFIIGPLTKAGLQQLVAYQQTQQTPVLALNHLNTGYLPENVYQFSLSAETEAEAIAQYAIERGHKQALMFLLDTDWGHRVQAAFEEKWKSLGGITVGVRFFKEKKNLSTGIEELLLLNKSKQRKYQLQKDFGKKLQFKPRRRTDADFVFLAAPPEFARQIKPFFDFHFAEDLPIYATSSVYSGIQHHIEDQDLDKIVFCDMPWILESNKDIRKRQQQLAKVLVSENFNPRLIAFGMDAYWLTKKLTQLLILPQLGAAGMTGMLRLTEDKKITRHLLWATFHKGIPKVLAQRESVS